MADSNLHAGHEALPVKYGLPEQVLFCRRCVISNQRPNSAVEFAHDVVHLVRQLDECLDHALSRM